MRLSTLFWLLMLVPLAGLGVIFGVSYMSFQDLAQEHVRKQASFLMDMAEATRKYTIANVRDKLQGCRTAAANGPSPFIKETVPAYAVSQTIREVFNDTEGRDEYSRIYYKQASDNPTNRADMTTRFEKTLLDYFRQHETEKEQLGRVPMNLEDDVDRTRGGSLYFARLIKVEEKHCLDCHGTQQEAESEDFRSKYGDMIKTYEKDGKPPGGFGWGMGDVVAMHVVYVPETKPEQMAMQRTWVVLGATALTALATIAILRWALRHYVINPISVLSQHAERLSQGRFSREELPVKGSGEIAQLTAAFNRMTVSLYKLYKQFRPS